MTNSVPLYSTSQPTPGIGYPKVSSGQFLLADVGRVTPASFPILSNSTLHAYDQYNRKRWSCLWA